MRAYTTPQLGPPPTAHPHRTPPPPTPTAPPPQLHSAAALSPQLNSVIYTTPTYKASALRNHTRTHKMPRPKPTPKPTPRRTSKRCYSKQAKTRAHIHKANVKLRNYNYLPGTLGLREILHYQKTSDLLAPELPFKRACKKSAEGASKTKHAFAHQFALALQRASEDLLADGFEDSHYCAIHANKSTPSTKDALLARRIKHRVPRGCGGS